MPMRVQGENKQLANVGRISTLPPDAIGLERDVYVASSFRSPQVNHFTIALQTLKRPEGRAPGGQRPDVRQEFRTFTSSLSNPPPAISFFA